MMSGILPIRAYVESEPVTWSDAAVAAACGHAFEEAVRELFERFEAPVTRFLSRLARGNNVDELVFATFLQVASGKARFDGSSSVKIWLFAIATNVFRRDARSLGLGKPPFESTVHNIRRDVTDGVSQEHGGSANVQRVRSAFESLSEKSRLAFVLCDVEGCNTRETSQILESSEVSIRQSLEEARTVLVRAAEGIQSSRGN